MSGKWCENFEKDRSGIQYLIQEFITNREENVLNITFILGNGFDLSCGLKSSYNDVYEGYFKSNTKNQNIEQFKNLIQSNYASWSDFETAMAANINKFSTEKDFLECLRDFKVYLEKHLFHQVDSFINGIKFSEIMDSVEMEIVHSIESFFDGINHDLSNQITFAKKAEIGNLHYDVVTFNYTDTFERIIKLTSKKYPLSNFRKCIHVHGKLGEDITLGVDNDSQLPDNSRYDLTAKGRRGFIKPAFNDAFDKGRVEAAKETIKNSNYICAFGWSMGETDQTWTEEIIKWLNGDSSHELILYQYECSTQQPLTIDERLDCEEDAKFTFLQKLGLSTSKQDGWLSQVHIPCGRTIFRIKEAAENGAQKKKENDILRKKIEDELVANPIK